MANQPRYNPLAPSDFFPDGRSARDPAPGTVPHGGGPRGDVTFAGDTGQSPEPRWAASVIGLAAGGGLNVLPVYGGAYVPPVRVDYDTLQRGRKLFNIDCSVCHDRVGTGRGKIVERGYLRPPSYHIDRLRRAPDMHFYDVITRGYGAMPSYEDKLAPDDRWAVITYIRALQLSQDASLSDLTPEQRERLQQKGGQP